MDAVKVLGKYIFTPPRYTEQVIGKPALFGLSALQVFFCYADDHDVFI
jgi:hypothetical protein